MACQRLFTLLPPAFAGAFNCRLLSRMSISRNWKTVAYNKSFKRSATGGEVTSTTNTQASFNGLTNVTTPGWSSDMKSQAKQSFELLMAQKPLAKRKQRVRLDEILSGKDTNITNPRDVSKQWLNYYRNSDVIVDTVPLDKFETIMMNAKKYPNFLIPLKRSGDYKFLLLQFAGNRVIFHAKNAPECLHVLFFPETEGKDIVMLLAEYDSKLLTVQQAQWLINELQMFYHSSDSNNLNLMAAFNPIGKNTQNIDTVKQNKP